ncbi:MAG: polyribonucleotide nucleotidyltransferase [Chlorobi bacterium]|nr:polyribonucleotide nucleotidyltransferase [Chlorobiota bacterium]
MERKTVSREIGGKTISLEAGLYAQLAEGAVMVRCGDTMLLAVSASSGSPREGIDFLPLQVEYREKYAAAGKVPGGFFKREARPSEHEILSARLIDRPIRPMFTKGWTYETQLICNVMSFDQENQADVLGAIGASAALLLSGMPFEGPISNVRVAHVDGEFIVNPTYEEMEDSILEIVVSGTDDSITMVEGEAREISEDLFVDALEFAHGHIRELNALQRELADLFEITQREMPEKQETPEEIVQLVHEYAAQRAADNVRQPGSKDERRDRYKTLREEVSNLVAEKFSGEAHEELELEPIVESLMYDLEKSSMRQMILEEKIRLDGRGLTDIRPISCEVEVLPRAHGSALFTRGETQSLTTLTLGTRLDRQLIDGLLPKHEKRFILHYNFPQFSTGETGRYGSTSRREVGHGNLAERALTGMIPDEEEFPYTIRIVSDILMSNGSSSMATVCAGSLAMMSGGVPLKKPVAGIAMGLVKDADHVAVLSDILGDEDFLGDMDFKVTGTHDGITACQMDMKVQGLSFDIIRTALAQAKEGRFHILDKMAEAISDSAEQLSNYAPRLTTIQISVDMIGAVIGSGGETIRSIVAESGADLDVQDDGTIVIAATSGESADKAIEMIEDITREPEEGEVYEGRVTQIREGLGAIIEFLPKKTGLLHISEIAYERTENVEDVFSVGDRLEVKLLEISDGRYRLSRRALLPKPEAWEEREDNRRGGDRRGGDRRGGGNRRRNKD